MFRANTMVRPLRPDVVLGIGNLLQAQLIDFVMLA
jgi:hypothetical protein